MITGCSESKPDTKDSADDAEDDKKKDELVMAFGSEPEDGFDPTTGWGRYGSPLFQSTLLKRNDDLDVVNDLAESYEIDEDDNKIWTVKLRDDVTFSDGESLTTKDVVFTFETAAENGSVVDLNVIDEVEALDETTVQFTLKEPRSTFVNTLIATGIVPEHAYGDDYADKPKFKKVRFLFLSDDASLAAAQAGEVDMAYIPAAFSNKEVPGMRLEEVETVDNRGIVFPYVKSGEETEDGLPIGNDVTA